MWDYSSYWVLTIWCMSLYCFNLFLGISVLLHDTWRGYSSLRYKIQRQMLLPISSAFQGNSFIGDSSVNWQKSEQTILSCRMTNCSGLANTEGFLGNRIFRGYNQKNPCAGQGTETNLVIHWGFIKPPKLGGSGDMRWTVWRGNSGPLNSILWVARAVYLVSHPLVISISKCVWISLYFNLQLRVKFQDYFPSVWTFLFRRFILVQVCWWKTLSFSISVITSSSFFSIIFSFCSSDRVISNVLSSKLLILSTALLSLLLKLFI